MNLDYFKEFVRIVEWGKLDMLFLVDSLLIDSKFYLNVLIRFELFILFLVLVQVILRIGLIVIVFIIYSELFYIVRQFVLLDYLFNGCVGWNVVILFIELIVLNFSGEQYFEYYLCYQWVEEFVEVVKGFWDFWEEDVFVCNKEIGEFFEKEKMYELNYKGDYFLVCGFLNVLRMLQGQLVIIQVGLLGDGKVLVVKMVEVIFIV